MLYSVASVVTLLGAVSLVNAGENRNSKEAKNVAIIGAGAAGSSAAYHLQKYAEEEYLAIKITLFEKTGHVGGRTLAVDAFGDALQPIELGASIFVSVNYIMLNASKEFGLTLKDPSDLEPGDVTSIWNGKSFVFESTEGASRWWDFSKLFWKYGFTPLRAAKLVKSVVGDFLKIYEAPYFPFRSLTQRAYELGLEKATSLTGEQYLAQNNINGAFGRDILQAATRVNYASNLAYIHGLETMVSFATDGAVAVEGGNWQIFEQMARRSGASISRNTAVTYIGKKSEEGVKYSLFTKDAESKESLGEEYPVTFDNVIVATPWQFGDIQADEGVLMSHIDKIPYTKLHVTLFTSTHRLNPEFFGLKPGSKAPSCVYTTLAEDEEPKQGAEGVGSTGFYSISTLKTAVNPKTGKLEFVYKIFSAEPVTSEFLTKIIGTEVPDTFISKSKGSDEASTSGPITWYYPHHFYSYPIELPRVTFQDPIVGTGVYYTSGIESFISTMETSALMGKNVARLIADDFAGISRDDTVVDDGKTIDGSEREPLRKQAPGEL